MNNLTPDQSKALEVINAIYQGIPLKQAIEDKFEASISKFFSILEQSLYLQNEYSRAQQSRSELLAEEIITIADTESCPQTARNRMEARKWYASKMKPNKFGEKIDITVNQTVDISGALADAKARVVSTLLPGYTALPTTHQVIDITHDVNSDTPDGISGEGLPKKSSFDEFL